MIAVASLFEIDLGNTFLSLMFCAAIVFLIVYSKVAPWWEHAVGQALASMDAVIIITLLPNILHLWFGISVTDQFFIWWRITSLAIGAATILWRTWTVWHVNREWRRRPLPPQAPVIEETHDASCPE